MAITLPEKADLQRLAAAIGGGATGISAAGGAVAIAAQTAALIDHTLLKPEASERGIQRLSEEAAQHGFVAVCVNPAWVRAAAEALRGTAVRVCSVAGFPLGANTQAVKVAEAERAIAEGAAEVDMVMAIGALKSGADAEVEAEIRAVAGTCHRSGAICKVILEMALLTEEEKVRGCKVAVRAGADFVKTSTGFGPGGATVEDVRLLRANAPMNVGVKAAGGIRALGDFVKMIEAGATRIGSSSGIKILEEIRGLFG